VSSNKNTNPLVDAFLLAARRHFKQELVQPTPMIVVIAQNKESKVFSIGDSLFWTGFRVWNLENFCYTFQYRGYSHIHRSDPCFFTQLQYPIAGYEIQEVNLAFRTYTDYLLWEKSIDTLGASLL